MYRIPKNITQGILKSIVRDQVTRCLATTSVGDVLFPTKSDFPSRHIGPRKTDVVSMLDTLGYKVNWKKIRVACTINVTHFTDMIF